MKYFNLLSFYKRFFSAKEIITGAFRFFLIPSSFFLIIACPEPTGDNTLNCGKNMALNEAGTDCICEAGYHWSQDHTACLLDTTSHNFVWAVDTLGSGIVSSILYDVAAIDENNIWAVGEIWTDEPDTSTGSENSKYNSAYWDGNKWKLIKITVPPYYLYSKRTSIFSFSINDIWMGSTIPTHWDGNNWRGYFKEDGWENGWNFSGYINGIWGTSSLDIYYIGDNGSIVHYNGSNFNRIETETGIDLISISGTGPDNVWVCGWDAEVSVLLHFDGNDWKTLLIQNQPLIPDSDKLTGPIISVFTDDPDSVWALTPFGIYRAHKNTDGEAILIRPPIPVTDGWYGAPLHLGGRNHNDLFITGYYTTVWHYNGKSFRYYEELSGSGPIFNSAVIGDRVFLVGASNSAGRALIYRGTRISRSYN